MKKNYFKKSLSLIMTVLMIMSCWVFFPGMIPEAEAALAYGTPAATTADSQTGTLKLMPNGGSTDYVNVKYPQNIYIDVSEDLTSAGYKVYLDGHYGDSNSYRTLVFSTLWGGSYDRQNGVLKNQTMLNTFNNYTYSAAGNNMYAAKENYSVDGTNWVINFQGASTNFSATVSLEGGTPKVGEGDYHFDADSGGTPLVVRMQKKNWLSQWPDGNGTWLGTDAGTKYTGDMNIYVHVYDKSELNTAVTTAKARIAEGSKYTFGSLYNLKVALNNNEPTLTTRNVTKTQIDNAANAINSAINGLATRGRDVTFENMFSLAEWWNSQSSCWSNTTYVNTNISSNYITIYNPSGSGEQTTASSHPNAHNTDYYSMPVVPNEKYIAEWTTDNASIDSEVFIFWYKSDNTYISLSNKNYTGSGKHTAEFTAPAEATMAEIRFDNNTADSTVKISDIAFYNSTRAANVGLADWTSRPYKKYYTYNSVLGSSLPVPARNGYAFNGWYLDSNNNGTKDSGEEVTDGNGNVVSNHTGFVVGAHYNLYSDWTLKTLDIGYDNLFSVSDWGYAVGSDKTNQGGDITVDAENGTISIRNPLAADSHDNNYVPWNYDIALEPNTEYIFIYDAYVQEDVTSNGMQVHLFLNDGPNASGTWLSFPSDAYIYTKGNTKGNKIIFTTAADENNLNVRLGTVNGFDITNTFSNIGLYKKADYDAYINGYSKIREPFKYGDAIKLMSPSRDGYDFDGWFTADGTQLTSVEGLYESDTVYAHWTKLWTVTFQNASGGTMHTATVRNDEALISAQFPTAKPTKASDTTNSYPFDKWMYNGAEFTTSITVTSDITVTPSFISKPHGNYKYSLETPATCDRNAIVTKTCGNCNYSFGEIEFDGDTTAYPDYAKLGHSYTDGQVVTGTYNGTQHQVRCVRYGKNGCSGATYVDHVWSENGTEGANCITPGTIKLKCPCGATSTKVGETAPNVHDNTKLINVKLPTCLEDGYTGDTYCNDCGTTIPSGKTDPKLGHSFTNYVYNNDAECEIDGTKTAKCDRCDVTDTVKAEGTALEHKYTNYVYNNDAKCEVNGTKTASCDNGCGKTKTIEAEGTALKHDYTGEIQNNGDGTHSYLCKNNCGNYGGTVDCSDWAAYGNTCKCADCGYTKDHDWGKWTKNNDNTALAAGKMTRTCNDCGATETTDCTYEITAHSDETCTTAETTTYTCTECGHGYTVIGKSATGHSYTSGTYKYYAATDTHQQLCANGCGTYGVGTEKDKTEACTWKYTNKEDGKHIASCVCGNSQEEACTGGQATCTAPATCEKCETAYGSTAPHSFTGTPVVLEGDKHAYRCVYCDGDAVYGVGENQGYTEACSGGTATCSAKAVCEVCGDTHGEINANNHKWSEPENVAGTLTHKYTCQYDNNHEKIEDCVCSSPAVLAPDCETAGYQQNYCDDCGHGWQTDHKDPLGHDWSAWISNDDGTHTKTCERAGCGYNTENPGTAKTETASCTKANATYVVTDPTCLDKGYTTYTCNDCGYKWVDDYTDATGHSYDKMTRKTTAAYKRSDKDCTTALTYWYVCDNCDVSAGTEKDKYENEADLYWVAEEPANHKFDKKDTADEYLKTEATCTASAVYYYSCSACGATSEGTTAEKTFESGSALGHAWENTEKYLKSAADCVNDAVYYKECSRCHISSEGETNETWTKVNTKTGHDFDHDNDGVIGNEGDTGYTAAVEPTCSDNGVLEHYTCSVCGKMYADKDATEQIFKVEVAAKGHDWKSVAYKAPTCEEDGHSAHKACSVCGTKNSDYQVREKTGHKFTGAYTYDPIHNYHSRYCVNENCLADGKKAYGIGKEKYSVELDGIDYVIKGGEACNFDSFTTATDENGLHSHNLECVCGNAQSVVIDAANITTEVVAPTCTDAGYTLNTCQKDDCGDTWKTDIVEKLGHDLKGNATSNGNGTHSVKCARNCGYSADAEKCSTKTPSTTCGQKNKCDICGGEFGEEIAHVFTNYVYNNDATCTADGTKTAECDNCDTNATDTITATGTKLGHDMSAHGYVVPEALKAKLEADGVVIAEPTCGEEGRSISYCSRCDHYVTKVVPKNKDAHDMPEEWTKVGGNCASGVTYVRACTVCGKKESKTESIPHNWKAIVIEEAGCTVNGYINFECSVCGFTATLDDTVEGWPSFNGVDYSDKNIVATGKHVWQTEAPADEDYMMIDGVVVFVEEYPAYNTTGRGYKKCTICNAVEKVTIAAYGNAPEDHKHPELGINNNSTLKYVAEVKPTCNVGGHKGYYECTRCSYSQYNIDHDSFYIPALGHTAPNSKGKCDRCKTTLEEDSASKNCGCICHKDSGFMKFIYKILRFFWKLFGMNKTCACGVAHY